jgi:hypothetical protein
MATIKNDWVGYLDRSYQQIKQSLLSRVTTSNPELTDHSESNIFVIIISMFAGIAEMLGYYIDNLAQESFLATAQRTSSVIKHVKALDYRIKARSPELVDLYITFDAPAPSNFTLSAGLYIDSISGIRFFSTTDVPVLAGATITIVPISQISTIINSSFGTTNGTKNQKFSLGTSYAHKTLQLTIGAQLYTEVDTFARSLSSDFHYIVDIAEDGTAYIMLGDGIKGVLPINGTNVAVQYKDTLGPSGKIGAGQFDSGSLTLNSALPGVLLVDSANTNSSSSGGALYEALESIRTNAINSIRTLNRAVTRQDHIDILEAVSGVAKAEVHFCCGKTIDLYIVPQGGGLASTELVTLAQETIDDSKMVATFPVVQAAGETNLFLRITVTAKKRKNIAETRDQVTQALLTFGAVENQEINGAIRLSDLQALIDNLANVDFVVIDAMFTYPYARPVDHTTVLDWVNETRSPSNSIMAWRLEYDGTQIRVFKDGIFQGNVAVGAEYVDIDNKFAFTVNASTYVLGQTWEFNTYPYLQNLQLTDYTIFKIREEDLTIIVNAASTSPTIAC